MAVIEVHQLTRKFGELTAVNDLSLEVAAGEVLGLLGPNGAGKTTTIRLLAGIIAPTSGHAVVAGWRSDADAETLHRVIGLLTERPGFYHRLSARRNLEFFGGFYPGIALDLQVEKHLRAVGLWERREDKVGTFSKGMQQRLALARALLHEPEILFLDEPTAGLDPEVARYIRQLISGLSQQGRTIFLSTHNLTEAESMCHRIAVIRTRLLAVDTAERLRRRFFRRQVVVQLETLDDTIIQAVDRLDFVHGVQRDKDQIVVELAEPDRNRPELVQAVVDAGGRVLAVSEKQYPLEEVYLRLVGEDGGYDG